MLAVFVGVSRYAEMDNPGDATDPEPISDVGFSGEEPTFPLSVTGVLHLGAGVQTPGERADGYHGHERPRGATNGAHSERAGVKDATGCGEGPKGGTVEVESEVDPVVPLPLEAAEAVATSQLEYLLSLSARDASAQRAKAARLRRLGKRSRLTADDANTVVQLREQLVATQAELDAFKARVVKHKEQFQASVLVLRERTEDQLVEAEGLRARVTALEAACDVRRGRSPCFTPPLTALSCPAEAATGEATNSRWSRQGATNQR